MFETRKVCQGGKVTIPIKARESMNIKDGDYIAIEFEKLEFVKSEGQKHEKQK